MRLISQKTSWLWPSPKPFHLMKLFPIYFECAHFLTVSSTRVTIFSGPLTFSNHARVCA